jgi:polyferredoxin
MRRFIKYVVSIRVLILAVTGAATYIGIFYCHISLLYILLSGIFLGLIFGKVFCRWACPIGLFMKILMSIMPLGKARSMYQYHKLGCPIAWISG